MEGVVSEADAGCPQSTGVKRNIFSTRSEFRYRPILESSGKLSCFAIVGALTHPERVKLRLMRIFYPTWVRWMKDDLGPENGCYNDEKKNTEH